MAKTQKYYISDIIGDGSEEDSFRVFIDTLGVNYNTTIPVNMTTGQPLQTWALTRVTTADHSVLLGLSEIDPLLDHPLTTLVTSLTTAEMSHLVAVFLKRGIDPAFLDTSVTYQDILVGIGEAADPSFNGGAVGLV